MKKNSFKKEYIDAVYTWVDNTDKNWINKKELERQKYKIPLTSNSTKGRFNNHDELRYSIRSIEKYIPWVRKIFIVTDSQRPTWLKESKKIELVDHKKILPNNVKKPVFNSLQIELYLHNIPGLSEKFIYFNDDFFINKKLNETDFFIKDKCVRYITNPAPYRYNIPKNILNTNSKKRIELIDEWFLGRKKNVYFHDNSLDLFHILNPSFNIKFNLKHSPYSITKKKMKDIHKKYEEFIIKMNLNQFRAKNDLFILSLIAATELNNNDAIFSTDEDDLFEYALGEKGYRQNIHDIYIIFENKHKFFNISEGNSPQKNWIELAINILIKKFKNKSKFEKTNFPNEKKVINKNLIDKYKKIYDREKKHAEKIESNIKILEKKEIIKNLINKRDSLKDNMNKNREKLNRIINSKFYKFLSKIGKYNG